MFNFVFHNDVHLHHNVYTPASVVCICFTVRLRRLTPFFLLKIMLKMYLLTGVHLRETKLQVVPIFLPFFSIVHLFFVYIYIFV